MTTQKQKKRKTLGQVIRANRLYFLSYFLALTMSTIGLTQITQGNENLYFVAFRGSIWDTVFKLATQLAEPTILAIIIFFLLFRSYRNAVSLLTALLISLTATSLAKLFFRHIRPVLYFDRLHRLEELVPVEGVHLLTGDTSFPSGHTMAAFAAYTLLALQSKQKKYLAVLFFIPAVSVGLSRIYLGQHFLKDVIAGSISGVLIGLVVYIFFERLTDHPKWNGNLIHAFAKKR